MGVMSKNTPIKLISSITLCIDCDQINSIGVFLPITLPLGCLDDEIMVTKSPQ